VKTQATVLLLAAAGFWNPTRAAESPDPVQGDQIFATRCASCHAKAEGRTPGVEALSKRTPEEIVSALRFGSMREQAQGLPLIYPPWVARSIMEVR
jgi:mono/diheme cytochrome c family protein